MGDKAPVIKLSKVDFPVPFCPTIATRESILLFWQGEKDLSPNFDGYNSLDTERKIFVKRVGHLSVVRECDLIESDDRGRKFALLFEVEVELFGNGHFLDETSCFHFVDDLEEVRCRGKSKESIKAAEMMGEFSAYLLLRFGLFNQIGICSCTRDET